MSEWEIEPLDQCHDRTSFDCGNPMLNEWLQRYSGQWERRDLVKTYVAARRGQPRVFGYYAISSHRVSYEALPENQSKGLPRIDIPVVLLGRLAVDKHAQGQGLGQLLLIDALHRADRLSHQLGIRAVEVEAIDENARRFYLKFGFTPLLDDSRHLFLSMHVIRKLW